MQLLCCIVFLLSSFLSPAFLHNSKWQAFDAAFYVVQLLLQGVLHCATFPGFCHVAVSIVWLLLSVTVSVLMLYCVLPPFLLYSFCYEWRMRCSLLCGFSCVAFRTVQLCCVLFCCAAFVVCCSVCFSLCGGFSRITFAVWCSLVCSFCCSSVVLLMGCDLCCAAFAVV